MGTPPDRWRDLASVLLDSGRPAVSLRPEVLEMAELLAGAAGFARAMDQGIAAGETVSETGLALSPTMAAMCADDYVRTIRFARGLHAAFERASRAHPDRPVRILYAGCGPLAMLAAPLLALHGGDRLQCRLLDLHAASVASVERLLTAAGWTDRVAGVETVDAARYVVPAGDPPDIILVEVMQACLEAEPQVAVARSLLGQAPGAIMIPEEVRVDLALVDAAREFAFERSEGQPADAARDRIPLGTVFRLDRENIEAWGSATDWLPAGEVTWPAESDPRYQPMLLTTVRIDEDLELSDYDSGLTCPRVPKLEGPLRPGGRLRFRYRLGPQPRLVAEWIEA